VCGAMIADYPAGLPGAAGHCVDHVAAMMTGPVVVVGIVSTCWCHACRIGLYPAPGWNTRRHAEHCKANSTQNNL